MTEEDPQSAEATLIKGVGGGGREGGGRMGGGGAKYASFTELTGLSLCSDH